MNHCTRTSCTSWVRVRDLVPDVLISIGWSGTATIEVNEAKPTHIPYGHADQIALDHVFMFSSRESSRLLHHCPLSVFPSLSSRLVQEYNTERSDEVHHHSRINQKGAINKKQRTPKRGAMMSDHHERFRVQTYEVVRPRQRRCGSQVSFRVLWY